MGINKQLLSLFLLAQKQVVESGETARAYVERWEKVAQVHRRGYGKVFDLTFKERGNNNL